VKRVQVYAAANNLFTLTGYTGVDPEVRFNDNGDGLVPGVDRRNTYLSTRTFSLGANFSF
jgi:iron complex outermembrane receptor protein